MITKQGLKSGAELVGNLLILDLHGAVEALRTMKNAKGDLQEVNDVMKARMDVTELLVKHGMEKYGHQRDELLAGFEIGLHRSPGSAPDDPSKVTPAFLAGWQMANKLQMGGPLGMRAQMGEFAKKLFRSGFGAPATDEAHGKPAAILQLSEAVQTFLKEVEAARITFRGAVDIAFQKWTDEKKVDMEDFVRKMEDKGGAANPALDDGPALVALLECQADILGEYLKSS